MAEAVHKAAPSRMSPGIDERRIVTALEANVIEADTIQGSEISEQRQRNHIHYAIDRIGEEKKGRSHHISADVLDAVESQKAFYQETFTGNRKPVNFKPENSRDKTFKMATEYVTDQFFREENDGYGILRDSYHDAMVAKRCVVKVEWLDDYEVITEHFQGLTQAQLMQLSLHPDIMAVDPLKTHKHPSTGTTIVDGTIDRKNNLGYCDIDLLQPERYFRDPNVSFIREATFAGVQEDMARYELIDRGFLEEEVMALKLDYRFRQNEEDTARKSHDSSWSRARRHKREPEAEIVTVYWHWAYLDLESFKSEKTPIPGIGDTRLYKFCWSQGKLMTLPETMTFDDEDQMVDGEFFIECKDGMPFFEWTQYKISHAEFGLCEADLMGDLQWTKSQLRRLIIDNQAMTNTSRWKARHGFIKNPRELLDNNIGSVLWVKDMNALEPLDTAPLSPTTFPLLETLDVEKENRNGMSRLAKGMSGDAISHQNADSMIQRLTNASNRRVLRGVRDYAETFLKPMFMHIYNLGRKYDKAKYDVEIDGQWMQMTPQEWPKRRRAKVQVALTPDEGREKGMFLTSMHGMMKDDPDVGVMYGVKEKHALFTDIFELMDGGDASRYMLNPASPEFQQKLQQRQEAQNKQIQSFELQEKIQKGEFMLKKREQNRKDADTATDNLRSDEEFQWERYMDMVEAGLEIEQERAAKIGNN